MVTYEGAARLLTPDGAEILALVQCRVVDDSQIQFEHQRCCFWVGYDELALLGGQACIGTRVVLEPANTAAPNYLVEITGYSDEPVHLMPPHGNDWDGWGIHVRPVDPAP